MIWSFLGTDEYCYLSPRLRTIQLNASPSSSTTEYTRSRHSKTFRSRPVMSTNNTPPKATVNQANSVTPSQFLTSGILTLYVGKNRKKYEIHKDLLRAKSKYFETMLADGSQWKEAATSEVDWDDEGDGITMQCIDVWADWLYGKQPKGHPCSTLLQCYKLAEMRMMPSFRNDIVEAIRRIFHNDTKFCRPKTLISSSELGLEKTALHHAMFQNMIRNMSKTPQWWTGPSGQNCKDTLDKWLADAEIAKQVVEALMRFQLSPWDNPFAKQDCTLHDHSDGSKCAI